TLVDDLTAACSHRDDAGNFPCVRLLTQRLVDLSPGLHLAPPEFLSGPNFYLDSVQSSSREAYPARLRQLAAGDACGPQLWLNGRPQGRSPCTVELSAPIPTALRRPP